MSRKMIQSENEFYGNKNLLKRDKVAAICNKINKQRDPLKENYISEPEVIKMIKVYCKEHSLDFIEGARKLSYEISQKILNKEKV